MTATTKNIDVRQYATEKRVFQYEVADALGMSVSAFCCLLRKDLTEEQKNNILQIIDRLAAGRMS